MAEVVKYVRHDDTIGVVTLLRLLLYVEISRHYYLIKISGDTFAWCEFKIDCLLIMFRLILKSWFLSISVSLHGCADTISNHNINYHFYALVLNYLCRRVRTCWRSKWRGKSWVKDGTPQHWLRRKIQESLNWKPAARWRLGEVQYRAPTTNLILINLLQEKKKM